jgi:hypothetical protein
MTTRIFISYSRHNADFARGIELQLNGRGFHVWLDTDKLRMGQFWREEIVQAISDCHYFVLLLSSRSIASENVVRELSLAEASSKPILPVMLEPVEIPDAMKYQLAGLQFVLVDSGQVDEAIRALLAVLPTPTPAGQPPSAGEAPSSEKKRPAGSDHCWNKTRLEAQLRLAIGPVASLLLESLPDPLLDSDRDALRELFAQQALDPALLEVAFAEAWIPPAPDPPAPIETDPAEDAALLAWLRLQLGPIADVIWDAPLRQSLRQAPLEARSRLEQLGVEPRVVEDLLRRSAAQEGSGPSSNWLNTG